MAYKSYPGNYLGIVVQNNDPEQRGRIKVFVPHISATVYKKWNEVKKDKRFNFIGVNIQSDLSDIIDDLKNILPWSECAAPLVGENTSARYNQNKKVGSISDTNKFSTFVSSTSSMEINPAILTKYSQNLDAIGEKLGNKYDIDFYRLHDAFVTPLSAAINNVNKHSYSYIPETFSNKAKGSFSVPSVGSHVWVFFNAGDPMKPVYFATSFGSEDWQGIYKASNNKGIDYPGSFENIGLSGNSQSNLDVETYRNKFVINQKGGSIQIVNTDNRETLKFTHFSGSFKEFSNLVNIELATNNDQKLVLGDQFETIRGDRNTFVQLDHDNIVEGNHYLKIGNLKFEPHAKWKQLYTQVANLKQLFEIKRTNKYGAANLKFTSPLQSRGGSFAACPVCKGTTSYYWKLNGHTGTSEITYTTLQMGDGTFFDGGISMPVMQDPALFGTYGGLGVVFGETCPCCNGTGISPSSMNGHWVTENLKNNINAYLKSNITNFSDAERQMGLGGSQIIDITKHKFETIGTVMNDFGSIRVDPVGKIYNSELVIHSQGVFANMTPTPLVEYVQLDDFPGGNYTLNVCNKYTVQVGSGGLLLKSFGPVNISGSITNIAGAQVNIASQNEVNIDGGHRLSLIADIVTIRQRNKKQVLIDSSLGVNKNVIVGGGMHVEGELSVNHITAPGEIQITDRTVVFGAPVKDITGMGGCLGYSVPLMFTETPEGIPVMPGIIGITMPGVIIGTCVITAGDSAGVWPVFGNGMPCIQGSYAGYGGFSSLMMPIKTYGTGSDDDCITMAPHSHTFKNIPLTLTTSNDELRQQAQINNQLERAPASPISNGSK
jgi:cytoskeletal protein CcmA (bactofilin family)